MPSLIRSIFQSAADGIRLLAGKENKPPLGIDIMASDWEKEHGIESRTDRDEEFTDYARAYKLHPWLYRCVNAIAQNVARVPMRMYKEVNDGDSVTYEAAHVPDFDALMQKPNRMTDGFTLWQAGCAYMLLDGNLYFEKVPYENKRIAELYNLRSDLMKVVPGEDGTVMGYLYKLNEKEVPFTADQVFHMHLWNPYTPYVGVGPASAARLALENDFYAISYNKWAMTNADTPGGILTSDQSYTDKQVEELRRLWKKAHGHVTNKERTAILHSGLKWQDTALKPKDAQWLEGRRTNREEICTVFGVPPSMAGAWKSVNYATAKEERLWFWNETIIPILQFIQTCVTYFLIKPHYGPEYLVEYDLSTIDALKETLDKKIDAVVKLTSAGVPLNSALHEVDLAPKGYPFPWGNRAYISAALMPTEDAPDAGKSITAVQRMKATVDHNAIWKAFDARRRKAEVAVQKAVGMGLEDIADEAVANVSQSMPEILHEISPAAISAVVDAAEARRAIIDRMKPVIEAIYAAEAEHEAAQQEKKSAAKQEPYGWEDLGPEALRYLGLLGDKIKTVVGTMKDDLVAMARAITPEMLEEGVSLTELCRKIREIIGDREHYRAARIARTETGSIMNAAHQDVFSKSDVVHSKRWVSMRDQDVRDTHRDLDGHEVDKSDDFITSTGNRLRYPNDPDGVPEEIIQCRCTMIGVTD